MNTLTFEAWMARVNRKLVGTCGLGCMDLPDADYRIMYDEGLTPREAAEEALQLADYPG